ncbi:MAG: hypothetical protein FWG31_09860 [Oscillospiraceae bacterium]|nr:hypothetical protein [Oscillospiraceae bacterium]
MKFKNLTACLLAVVMLTAAFAIPASAYARDEKTLQTPYGELFGSLTFFRDSGITISSMLIECKLLNRYDVDKVIATYEIVDYLTGASLKKESRTGENTWGMSFSKDYPKSDFPGKVTIFGCSEIRHTNSYAVWPRLVNV